MDDYVTKYARSRGITEEEALTHKIVQEVKAYYKDKDADKVQETNIDVGCGGAE